MTLSCMRIQTSSERFVRPIPLLLLSARVMHLAVSQLKRHDASYKTKDSGFQLTRHDASYNTKDSGKFRESGKT